jgi:hypothetical protein
LTEQGFAVDAKIGLATISGTMELQFCKSKRIDDSVTISLFFAMSRHHRRPCVAFIE